MAKRDIVVIGASTGGVELMLDLVGELPPRLQASLFLVIHTAPGFLSDLPELLSRRGPVPAVHAQHGDRIEPGRIYVAPPDNHLLVRAGFVEVVRGPRENGHRPAVDPLFRTASWSYGPRVVGVVLSGHLDCGTAGLMSVKARGGVAVVQEPATAAAADMPLSALRRVQVDHVVQPIELPGLIARLAAEDAPAGPPRGEARAERLPGEALGALEGTRRGAPAELVCPACHGVLSEANVGPFRLYRCHVGHAFSLESLLGAQNEEVERALWSAVRALEEGAALAGRLEEAQVDGDLRRRFRDKEQTLRRQAELLRQIALRAEPLPADEPQAGAQAH